MPVQAAVILAIAVVVPPFMHVAGHFRSYYRWMVYIPLAICIPRLWEMHRELGALILPRRVVVAAISLSLFMGVPLRTMVPIPGWRTRDHAPLEQVAAQVARPADVVVANFKTYFALRPRTKLLFGYGLTSVGEFTLIPDLPTNDISLLCLLPDELAPVTNVIGGNWKKVPLDNLPGAAALSKTRYAVDFYRRDANP